MRIFSTLIKKIGKLHGRFYALICRKKYGKQIEELGVYLKNNEAKPISDHGNAYYIYDKGMYVVIRVGEFVCFNIGFPDVYTMHSVHISKFNLEEIDRDISFKKKIVMGMLSEPTENSQVN